MREASEKFGHAVRGSHRAISRVEIWRGGELIVDDLPIAPAGSTLDVDGERTVPGELSLTVPGREWDPILPLDPLSPFGQRAYAYRGVRFADGTEELIGLGWYLLHTPSRDPIAGSTTVQASSLERLLEDARFQRPQSPPGGATYWGEVGRIVGNRLPTPDLVDLPAGVVNRSLPTDRVWEEDRLEALSQLAAAWPCRFRVDDVGLLAILPPAVDDPGTLVPEITLSTGSQGVVAGWVSQSSRDQIYNGVIARGEESTADSRTVQGFAWDDDEGSPTYWHGPFGQKPLVYSSPLLTTRSECQKAAATMLAKHLRRTRLATVELVPDPRIDLDTAVRIETEAVSGVGRVTGYTLPLAAAGGTMRLTVEMGREA